MATELLLDAACNGKLDVLTNLLKQNPSTLVDFGLVSLGESLLHVATKSGHLGLGLVREVMNINPEIAREVNKDGFRPLDVAVITGNLSIFKEILSFKQELCLLKGKDRRTALHYAAIKGRVDVIDELLHVCPNSIEDVTVYGETALHLAVKGYHFDAFASLVQWVGSLGKESIINKGDVDGDTILHLAVSTKQFECVELFVGENGTMRGMIEPNARNLKGLTPLDVLDVQDSYDAKISRKLESAGAIRSPNSTPQTTQRLDIFTQASRTQPQDWFKYFKFQMGKDSPSDARNALLLVAALIATFCFQAGVNPPNGILPQKPNNNTAQVIPGRLGPSPPPPALDPKFGLAAVNALADTSAIAGSHLSLFFFLFANSLGFSASTSLIIYLTSNFPFQREFHMALYSMMFTYGFAISLITKELDSNKKKVLAYVLLTAAFLLPFALRWLPRWGGKAWKRLKKNNVTSTLLPV